jgi:hypothetical protein
MNNQQITDEKKALENRFAEVQKQKQQLEEELYRLQGEYRVLERLEQKKTDEEFTADPEPDVNEETTPSE